MSVLCPCLIARKDGVGDRYGADIGLLRLEREKMAFHRAARELERASNEWEIDGETCGWMELDILALSFSPLFRIRGTRII